MIDFIQTEFLLSKSILQKFKTPDATFQVLCVLVNHCVFYMINLGGDASWRLALLHQTDVDCSSSIDNDEEQFKALIKNRGKEVAMPVGR